MDRPNDAIACLLRATGLKHDHADARLAMAQILLARGDLEPGWIEYEWRNLTEAGKVSEGSAENLFMLRGGKLVTPGLNDDILEGITRAGIIEIAAELGVQLGPPHVHTYHVGRPRLQGVGQSLPRPWARGGQRWPSGAAPEVRGSNSDQPSLPL